MGNIIALIREYLSSKGDDSQEQDNSVVQVRRRDMIKSTEAVAERRMTLTFSD